MSHANILDVSEQLLQLDPVRSYPQRAAEAVASLVGASGVKVVYGDREVASSKPTPEGDPTLSLPLRSGRSVAGTLHLYSNRPFADDDLDHARWGARILARGLGYRDRLAVEGGRRSGESVSATLKRAPLTPRERDVVALLVAGCSTRDIASRTGLTVSTVNTYLKRIFSKLGVHSRVELVARMAGTEALSAPPANETENVTATEI